MKLPSPYSAEQIASLLKAKVIGNGLTTASGINEIHKVQLGDIAFVDHPKYYEKTLKSPASIVLINKEMDCPEGKALILTDDPFKDFNKLILQFSSFEPSTRNISPSASIGKGTVIQPGAFIGDKVNIGKNCIIHANATINQDCQIDDNSIIHAGTVIGGDAFYYQKRNGNYEKFNSCGRVIIGKNVEIGANCSIDRGVTGDTVIGDGTKIDNMVHIGHDTEVGKNCLFAAQVGIAGATIIEDDVVLWGQVGVISGIVIEKGAVVLAQAGVGKTLKGNITYFGSPAGEAKAKMRELASLRNLPNVIKKL